MNRAQRRGNTVRSRWSGANGVRLMAAAQERSGIDHETGKYADAPKQEGPGRNASRDRTGRFAAAPAASVTVALPPALTRQQRRFQERQAAKVAKAWRGVTNGDGVTLVDSQPID